MDNFLDSIAKINRKKKILELLEIRGTIAINKLAKALNVSPITLRKDLQDLQKQRLINRIWGGVSVATNITPEPPFEDRNVESLQEKRSIARVALTLVKPNDVIGLGGGTTIYEFAKLLGNVPNIQVITNAVNIAHLLLRLGVRIVMPGGFSREGSYALVNDKIKEFFKGIFIDKYFLGADGVDIEAGLTTLNPGEAIVNETMISVANKVIVLADYTKLGQRRLVTMSPVGKVSLLITDEKAPKKIVGLLKKRGVKVEIASRKSTVESYSMSEYKFE